MNETMQPATPWQRVYAKLGMSQAQLAGELRRHRAKLCRALKDPVGIITGHDQVALLKIAKARDIELEPDDLIPRI